MEIDLVGESLKFMVLGMLIVFIFLAVLVQIMKLQAKFINRFFPGQGPEVTTTATSTNAKKEAHHVSAIIAAVTEFRKR